MSQPLRGVNLGGWLVLEPWITPSLFVGSDAPDEFSYSIGMDSASLRRLRKHYREFITEADFAWLAEQGIQAVRLPVGYWLFGDVAPYQATFPFIDKAIAWADKYGLQVLLDLHGAPGSQNGKMHSGRQGEVGWGNDALVDATLHFLQRLAKHYGQQPALLGISLLNEPSPKLGRPRLRAFYKQAHASLLQYCRPDVWLVFSDGFRHRRWRRQLSVKQYPNLLIDHHQYQIFGLIDRLLPAGWQVWRAKHVLPAKLRRMATGHRLVVGEWSLVLRGSKLARLSDERRHLLACNYAAAQLKALKHSTVWFYWTYKTETGGAWSYRDCVARGWL